MLNGLSLWLDIDTNSFLSGYLKIYGSKLEWQITAQYVTKRLDS